MKFLLTPLVALVALAAPALAYDIGPAVGSPMPALHATDATGAPRTLKSLTGPKGVVLVFFRSAKWCPFCQAQLLQLKTAPAELEKRGYRLAAISYDAPETLAAFAEKRAINYTLLSDQGSVTIDAFGLRDKQYPKDSMAYGVPEPAMFVIAPNGVIRARLAEQGYRTRPTVEALLATVDALPPH